MNDEAYMKRALTLAENGAGWVNPNPLVGAVIVKDGRIIGEGWHERYGGLHAERNALKHCTEDPRGATLYVTLEPCCHYGKQPPCTDAIVEAGIRRVVVGSSDPNPLVAGKGNQHLRDHGIDVTEGVLKDACDRENRVFLHYITTQRPYVVMKYAMTLDGKIATQTGASRWITGEAARHHVQTLRHRYSGIMVGSGTVLADDPSLRCHLDGGKDPVRIICDTRLRTPLDAQVVTTARETPTVIATAVSDATRLVPYQDAGCQVLTLPTQDGHLDLTALMAALGEMEIDSVLLEGGGTLNWSALTSGIVQQVDAYIAPKLFGGERAKTPVRGLGVETPDAAIALTSSTITRLGDDFLIESEVESNVHRHY